MKDDSWHVKTVQRGLNMTISQAKASGVTPSELLFGTKLRFVPESIREKAKAGFDTEQSKQNELKLQEKSLEAHITHPKHAKCSN
jgi:hypothetical protein